MFHYRIWDHRVPLVDKIALVPQVLHEVLPGSAVGDEIDIH
jgi:hypothetical protein